MKEITLEKAKLYRLISRIAFTAIGFVLPMVIVAVKFKIFTAYTNTKISIMGIILLLIIAWRFKKKLFEWINSWENSNVLKWILIGLGRVWPFLLVVVLIAVIHWSATRIIGDALFCLEWVCACELFCYLIIYPFEMKMDYLVKRMTQKNERKEDYKEAIREMKEQGETL